MPNQECKSIPNISAKRPKNLGPIYSWTSCSWSATQRRYIALTRQWLKHSRWYNKKLSSLNLEHLVRTTRCWKFNSSKSGSKERVLEYNWENLNAFWKHIHCIISSWDLSNIKLNVHLQLLHSYSCLILLRMYVGIYLAPKFTFSSMPIFQSSVY